ncbi:hypothetical protein H8356DRAFT_1407472 [Neocallimastix lanati (nom. inval.)]|nr:hypothetical protein H8356DRAFT_1407472 [Neocallimastix sp. JGI-2020a]
MDDVIKVEQNKLNMLKTDNFREKNIKIGNINNRKYEINNNILIIKEENKNNFTGNTNIKKNQNNNIEINSTVKINIKATSSKENINYNNKNILEDSENINSKGNNHRIVKEEMNINESIKVDSVNNKTNNSITSSLIKELNINDNKCLKINTIQITSYENKNEQFTKKEKIINKNSPIDESSKVVNVDSDKKIKINKIKKIIKIPNIRIQNNNKNKININKIMMPKPEISLKKIINYSNNRVYTKRTNRNYKYKRK